MDTLDDLIRENKQLRAELAEWRKHEEAVRTAEAMLQAARPLVLNLMRLEDAKKAYERS